MPKHLPIGPQPPKPPGPPPIQPPDFRNTVEGWEKKAREHMEAVQKSSQKLSDLGALYERVLQPPETLLERIFEVGRPFIIFPGINLPSPLVTPEQKRGLKQSIVDVELVLERDDFYARLYSQVPIVISGGGFTTIDELLAILKPPANITSEELDDISDIVGGMVETLTDIPQLPELALEAEPVELPGLIAPPTIVTTPPTTISSLTVDAIVRSITAPKAPPSVMSREEWETFMVESQQISDKADLDTVEFLREQANSIVDEWQERDNMLAAYRAGIAKMPDYEIVDLLKEMVIQPGMALLEIAGIYFERVSMPLAGLVWGVGFGIGDMEAAFQRYRREEGTWQALGHAWEEWDAPGEGAAGWILKYMLMEGLVDPLTYAGWGIATRLAKPLGPVGRWIGFAERGMADALELPFDLIKSGIRRLPKTTSQQANIAMAKAGQYVDKFLTQRFGKAIHQMTMGQFREGAEVAIKYTLKNPQIDNITTRAGKELLKHVPVTEGEVLGWASRLGTTLTPEQITRQTIANVDGVFEDFFSKIGGRKKLVTNREAADELVRILVGNFNDETSVIAGKILLERSRGIINGGLSFGRAKTTFSAMRQLSARNRKLFLAAEGSDVALALKEMGRVSTLLTTVPLRIQKAWVNGIDRWVIRPFAEAYLTFALYGPMNVFEDVFRTLLGGVIPGGKSAASFARRHAGVSYDRSLVTERSVSETMGFLKSARSEDWSNWILQLGSLAKGFGRTAFEYLVGVPGQISMAMRLHFVDVKYTQILKEMGGEALDSLTHAGPDKLMGVSGKRLVREIQQTAMEIKMNGLPDALRAAKDDFTRAKIIRREVDEILKEHPDLPPVVRDFVMRQQDDNILFRDAGNSIDQSIREADNLLIDDFIASPERASAQYEQLANLLVDFEVRNPQEMAQLIQSLNLMSSVYGATPKQILGRAVERTRGLPFAERRASMDKAMDSISLFTERAGASMDRVVAKIKLDIPNIYKDNPAYISKSEQLFNLQTSKRLRASELGEQINAWRHDFFAEATPADLKSNAFWDDFSREVSGRHHASNIEMADFDGMIKNAIDDLDIAGGLRPRQRPAIKVTNRELAPQDVAQLIGARGDDISRALMDVLTAQNDRDMFTSYVMAHVKPDDVGFNKESIGRVYDQIALSLQVDPKNMSWITGKRIELEAVRRDLHSLHNSKLLPDEEIAAIGKYFDDTADAVQEVMFTPKEVRQLLPESDIGLGERLGSAKDTALFRDEVERLVSEGVSRENAIQFIFGTDIGKDLVILDPAEVARIRDKVITLAEGINPPSDVKFLPSGVGEKATLKDFVEDWFKNSNNEALQAIGKTASGNKEYLSSIRIILNEQYPSGVIRIYRGGSKAGPKVLEREFTNVTGSRKTAIEFEDTWNVGQRPIPTEPGIDNVLVRVNDIVSIGAVEESELIIRASVLKNRIDNPIKPPIKTIPSKLRPEFTDYNDLRQSAMDEAHIWYRKEFTDYSSANAFDSIMKAIYPFWTYESQRWFWLPRSFIRHPGTFTSFERWQDNTDYGYIHIPGTSVDINPFRGTIYGTLATRLARRDYPEYYDSLGAAGDVIEFSDWLSRYGFYPGAHIGVPLVLLGGPEMQAGEALPSIFKTPLDILIATFPDNESVRWISDHVFGDRFRKYLEILQINRRGGDGSLIFSKQQEGVELTEEEQQLLSDARREVGWYSAGFEQTGVFRMRTDEQTKMYEEASKVIEEMTGYTKDQQDWLRKHGYRLWDMVGGMSPSEQAILQEMDYYRWVGNVRPLLPGKQQEILNKIELAWDSVNRYTEQVQDSKLLLQREFLAAQRGPDDYNSMLLDIYDKQREFIDNKIEEYPLMDLDNRAEYYKKYGQPQPVLHPMRELMNLYFSIELLEMTDPETGEKRRDWDNFWAQRQAIEEAVPDEFRREWEDFLAKNSTRMEQVRRDVSSTYFRTYNKVWEKILSTYNDEEQSMIEEYLFLERTGQKLDRQAEIKATQSEKTGKLLISSFRSEVSGAKKALRFANPHLDAWLFYWGRTSTFVAPGAEDVYEQIAQETGRKI